MKLLACVAGILLLAGAPALSCPSPLTGKDAGGTTQNFGVTLDGSANCYGNVALVDGSNAANKATVTAGNALKVDGSAVTQPVSGTVTSNQGGAPWSVSQSGNWTVRAVGNSGGVFDFVGQNAAQPANSILIGGEFNTTPTTLTTGNASPLQLDSSGNLLVNIKGNAFGTLTVTGTVAATQGTSPWVENVSQFGGNSVVTGTGASGVGIPRVTVANDSNVLATQSGTWTVQQGGAPWTVNPGTAANWGIGATAAAVPANAQYVGMSQGGNLTGLTGTSGNLNVQCANCSGSGVSTADEAAFTAGSSLFAGAGGFFQTTATSNALTTGQQGMVQMTAQRAFFVNLRDSSGTELGTSGNQLFVNCATGCAGGSFNNNSDAVATSATNGQAAAWLYGFNGTTWDRLRVDGSKNLNVNIAANSFGTLTVSGTVTSNQGGAPWSVVGNVASGASDSGNPVKTGGVFNSTQPTVTTGQRVDSQSTARGALIVATGVDSFTVGGTVTANAGTNLNTSALALDTSVNGLLLSQGSTTSGQKGPIIQGAVTTNAPTYTTAQTSPLSLDTAGLLRMSLKDTPANTNNLNVNLAASAATVAVSGTVTANQGSPPWTIQGDSASGAANAGNPVKGGGAFNTTQPTVTNGQTVDSQYTARGAAIVATGVDAFTVQPGNTANTTPWLFSISQGGNTAAVNASSQLSVNCANCSGSGVSQQDLTGFTFGTTNMVPVGGVYSTAVSAIPSGQAGVARLTANRAIQHNQVDSAGREIGSTIAGAANAVQVNQVATLNVQNTGQFAVRDAYGNPIRGSIITDGQDYADVVSSTRNVGPANGGLVVVPSPRLSLQCPFTVGINQTASTQIVTNPGGKALHICGFGFVSASAQNVSLVEGTGSTCGTGTGALVGGTTASIAAAANGGLWNMTDRITIPMQKAGDNLCVLQSAAGNVSGTLTYGIF